MAAPTVYAVFQSKARILSLLVAAAGADEDIRAVARRAMAQRDPRRRVNAGAHVIRLILDREGDLTELLWQAGSGEPALREVWRQSNQQRLRRLTELFSPLAENGQLRAGVNLRGVVDIFWALSSPEVYRLLVSERGWSSQRYQRWLAAGGRDLLLL